MFLEEKWFYKKRKDKEHRNNNMREKCMFELIE